MQITSYRDLLKDELQKSIGQDATYSLRMMARQAKISPAMLSAIINGKRNLSTELAMEISKRLGFDKRKSEYFVTLVQYESVKSDEVRADLLERIKILKTENSSNDLDLNVMNSLTEWYHLAVLQIHHTALTELTPQLSNEALHGFETLAFDSDGISKANRIIEDCFNKISRLASNKKKKSHVYYMRFQLLHLTGDN